jgi:thiamine biosynthesis lipoprotein
MSARAARVLLTLLVAACSKPTVSEPRRVDGRAAMGTVLEIDLRGLARERADALLESLFAEVAEQDRLFSRFEPQAALAALNARAGSGWQPVDPRLAAIAEQSVALSRATRGSFDVTVGPLVELWTRAGQRGILPRPGAIAEARSRVGVDRIAVRVSPPAIELAAGASLDLGGIAKGFALDRLLPRIEASGASAALLSFGQSSVHALGAPAGEPGWRILLPDAADGFAGVIELRDRALSVSSSVGQSSVIEGRRYGHVIDPRTGMPITAPRLAAVVAASGAAAEALSKALLLLDEAEAAAVLAELPGAHALRIEADGRRWYSEGWLRATRFAPPPADLGGHGPTPATPTDD